MKIDFVILSNIFRPRALTAVVLDLMIAGSACRKLVTIPPPQNAVVPQTVFSSDNLAVAAVVNIYSSMINSGNKYSNSISTICGGLSADEFNVFDQTNSDDIELQSNNLLSTNNLIANDLWQPCYSTIYQSNAVIEGLSQYTGVDDSTKQELLGEAKFLRALAYFYAANFFGNIPLVLTTNWNVTKTYTNSPPQAIYQQMISDLKFAQEALPSDYSVANGERTRANKWAATALLARVYLYQGDWTDAFAQANSIIGNSQYALTDSLNQVFNANSMEAIFQLQPTTNSFNYTPEGALIIPDPPLTPFVYLTPSLLNAFEPGDNRRNIWVDSINYSGTVYYYPFKYNIGRQQAQYNVSIPQYYMVLRLGEQYLIRAEAEANGAGTGTSGAVADLNVIRQRAGLGPLSDSLSQPQVLKAVAQERRVELFAEWGHRWFDLIRTGNATRVLSVNKGITVTNNALLYPIPNTEIIDDPLLRQNPGYSN